MYKLSKKSNCTLSSLQPKIPKVTFFKTLPCNAKVNSTLNHF